MPEILKGDGNRFIQKPYGLTELSSKLHEVLSLD
jgi:hypothetical protein